MPQQWFQIARQAAPLLQSVPYGQAMAAQQRVAEQLGTTRQALRNYLAAHDYILSLERAEPALAHSLMNMPVTAVAAYQRWSVYAPRQAYHHLQNAVENRLAVRTILNDERQARYRELIKQGHNDRTPTELSLPIDGVSGPVVTAALQRFALPALALSDLEMVGSNVPLAHAAGVNNILAWQSSSAGKEEEKLTRDVMGIIRINPSPIADAYKRMAKTILARASLASTLYPVVAIELPDPTALKAFRLALPPLPASTGFVSWQQGVALAPCLGLIIISSRHELPRHWAM